MGEVYSDARVLSLVQKQHGQRGVRELQGNALRKALHTVQQHLVSWYHVSTYVISYSLHSSQPLDSKIHPSTVHFYP